MRQAGTSKNEMLYVIVIVLLELLQEMLIKIVEKDDFYMAAWFVKNSNSCMFS